MNVESAVLRVVYHADRHSIETEDRMQALMYLVAKNTAVECSFDKQENGAKAEISSDEVTDAINDLEKHRLLETDEKATYGGDKRVTYILTEKGVSKAELLITDDEIEEQIESIVAENGGYPISNLLNDIKESEPANQWT